MWFTESIGNKIARISPDSGAIVDYSLPNQDSDPNGIVSGSDGNLWFTESGVDKIGKITTGGVITEYAVTAGSTPLGITTSSDRMVTFGLPKRMAIT